MQATAAGAGQEEIGGLEIQAARAVQAGRLDEAAGYWGRILQIAPGHPGSLLGLGQLAFTRGDMEAARVAFDRLVRTGTKDPRHWVNLGIVCRNLGDEKGEEEALQGAMRADPSDLLALLARGNLYERQGKRHQAAKAYGAAATVAPRRDLLMPELRQPVAHAELYKQEYDREFGAFLDRHLEGPSRDLDGADLRRFRESVDIMVGRKRRYDSQSVRYHFPRLPAIEFFERELFPWMETMEGATEAIRSEFLAVQGEGKGFAPYIQYPEDEPKNQWHELDHSPRWSAFHLIEMGRRIEGNAERCPRTLGALAGVPQPVMAGRTPSAMFSVLQPKTRIPPHTGVTNVRLVAHLPLIVPPGCGFRVGNETRHWVPGRAWVFDDTIDHEAWNDSDMPRAILIFDVWHPQLTAAERAMITAMAEAMEAFVGRDESFSP
jgi:aspartyl/asparaginyl beta-hydroxylase (cupin superfamily)